MAEELVYVSWGGTGRGATLRAALERAAADGKGLLYLAVLDDATFADLDRTFLSVVRDELAWLVDTQLELTKNQLGAEDISVRVIISGGDVVEEVADVVTAIGETEVMIGAPVPLAGHQTVGELLDSLQSRLSVPVSVVEADEVLFDDDDNIAAAD